MKAPFTALPEHNSDSTTHLGAGYADRNPVLFLHKLDFTVVLPFSHLTVGPGKLSGQSRRVDGYIYDIHTHLILPQCCYKGMRSCDLTTVCTYGAERQVLGVFLFAFFLLHSMACGILVPRPGIELMPLAVKGQSHNH